MMTQRLVGIYQLFFMALGLTGLSTLFAVLQRGTLDVSNFFSFQANLLAAFTFFVTGVASLRSDRQDRFATLRGFASLATTLTGVIYFLLLRGLEEQLQIPVPWVNTVLHYVVPVAVLADWLVVPLLRAVRVREALVWALFPALYVPYSLIRGAVVGWYPYPFLNASVQGYGRVAVTCTVMLVGLVILSTLLAARTRFGQQPSST